MRPHNRSRMAVVAAILMAAAVSLGAQSAIYVSSSSAKTYHTHADCPALKRAKHPTTIARSDIGARSLCKICARKEK